MQGPRALTVVEDPITNHGPTYRHVILASLEMHPDQYGHMVKSATRQCAIQYWLRSTRATVPDAVAGGP